jgi:putative oxidoreductase
MGRSGVQARPAGEIAEAGWERYRQLDARVIAGLRRCSLPLLRVSLGLVFVWFGALKVLGVTPVDELVASVVYWADPAWLVPALGVFEVAVGLGLLVGKAMRLVLLLFAAQMVGTFLVFVVLPDVAFYEGNPVLLTVEGEFVVKNLVLLSAGLVVASRIPRPRPWGSMDHG